MKSSASLRRWDKKRTADERWYKDNQRLGMLMYVDCFAGTLKGVKEKLPYIRETGVNYLHLMPLLISPKGRSDGGYAVSDFRNVEPKLGNIEDLSLLSEECHKDNISICLDFVMNHTSEDHEWAVKARQGDPQAQSRYFFFDDWSIPNEYEKTVPQVFPQTAPGNFTWCDEAKKVVMTTFYPYQWDLNYGNPTVFNDMTANMLYNVTTMASTWHTVATQDVRLLEHQLGSVFALPKDYVFLNYLRCHDDIGWGLDYNYLKQFGLNEVGQKNTSTIIFAVIYTGAKQGESSIMMIRGSEMRGFAELRPRSAGSKRRNMKGMRKSLSAVSNWISCFIPSC